jgi:hypothetical protein
MFSGIGGFELGISRSYRTKDRGSQANTKGNKGQGLVSEAREGTCAADGQPSKHIDSDTGVGATCVGYSEIEENAIKIYEKNFPTHKNFGNTSPTSTSSAVASLVNLLASAENVGALKILEELYSLKSQGFWPLKDLSFCYWKTSKDFSHTITGTPLEQSSQPFLTWGTFYNGKYATARISASLSTGNACSLSDIMEKDVHPKYFLSPKVIKNLKIYNKRQKDNNRGFQAKFHGKHQVMNALKVGGKGANDLVVDN